MIRWFVLFVFLPMMAVGQNGFEQGYVITNTNDTLFGYIKDRQVPPFGKLYKRIRFNCGNHFKKRYGPYQIKEYKKGNEVYQSIWLEVYYDFFREEYVSLPHRGEKKFVKIVEKGYLNYYQLEYEDAESGYVEKIDLFKRADKNSLVRVTQGIFGLKKKRLSEYFYDCPELVYKIHSGELSSPIAIVQYYNRWIGSKRKKQIFI